VRKLFVAAAAVFALGMSAASAQPIERRPTFEAVIKDVAGKEVGNARFIGVRQGGTQIHITLHDMAPGVHGLHVHEVGSCNPLRDTQGVATPFGAVGPHFDPNMTNMHKGPDGGGHSGDLPNITVYPGGNGGLTTYAKGLDVTGPNTIVGRAIIIHANEDNYSDTPAPNGGSGGRIACGEIDPLRA
jgi:Cu-Zn family superoxide dismutase